MTESGRTLILRDARPAEDARVREVTLAAYAQYGHTMPPERWQEFQQVVQSGLAQTGPVERIVAEQDGQIVGSVLLFPPAGNVYGSYTGAISWPEVRLLAVMPAVRGQGVGTALMEECARRARQMGATTLGLHTSDEMASAKRMYERMGFVRMPEHDFRALDGHLVMAYRHELRDEAPFLA